MSLRDMAFQQPQVAACMLRILVPEVAAAVSKALCLPVCCTGLCFADEPKAVSSIVLATWHCCCLLPFRRQTPLQLSRKRHGHCHSWALAKPTCSSSQAHCVWSEHIAMPLLCRFNFKPGQHLILAGTIQFAASIQLAKQRLAAEFPYLTIPQSKPLSPGWCRPWGTAQKPV